MAGIVDVAAAAGVTVGTVSRVLNGDPSVRVRPETRERIHAAARAVNYTPNRAARALRRARLGTLALAVHDVSNPVYAAVIAGAQQAASRHGYVLMLADVPELARDAATFSRVVNSGIVDGLLLLPAGIEADRRVAEEAAGIVPTVIVNDSADALGSVTLDNEAAARMATEHLIGLGHRDIGLLELDGETERGFARTRGWEAAMRTAGLPVNDAWVRRGGHTAEAGRQAMGTVLDRADRPTAVMAASVLAAVGAVAAARDRGLDVPADLSVVGFHDVFFAQYLQPGLTVVELPLQALGHRSVELLLALLDHGEPEHVVITEPPPRIVVRGTTARFRPPAR